MRVVVGLAIAFLAILLSAIFAGPWLIVNDELEATDFCMSMSGRQYRIREVIDLHNKNICEFVFLAKGGSKPVPPDSLYASKNVVNLGVPKSSFIIDDSTINSSFEEIVLFLNYLKKNNLIDSNSSTPPTLTIITDPYHTRRVSIVAKWVFGLQVEYKVRGTTGVGIKPGLLWMGDSSVRKFVVIEFVKIVYYYVRYRFPSDRVRSFFSKYDRIND